MKANDLREMDEASLQKELQDLLKAQFSLRLRKSNQQIQKTSEIRKTRRDIARVRTILAQKAATK